MATAAGASVILASGEIVDITRAGGYVRADFYSDTEIRLITPEGAIEVGPVPTTDITNTSWRLSSTTPALGPAVDLDGEIVATAKGIEIKSGSLLARVGPQYNTGWMPPGTVRALFCDNVSRSVSAATPLNDDCSSVTGWTLGAGWTHNATEFDHTPGSTAPNDRALTGLVVGTRYRVRFLVANRTAGSLATSLVTANDEAGALSVTADGENVVGFTAAATTDTIRFTPDTAFDGSVQNVVVEVSFADRGPAGRDARAVGALTAELSASQGEIRHIVGWDASNYIEDAYTSDLDFTGDFFVAFVILGGVVDGTIIQRASAADSGVRWEVRIAGPFTYFYLNDGTDAVQAQAALTFLNPSRFNHYVVTKRGNVAEIWINGVLAGSADATAIGSLANASATVRYGSRLDGTKQVPSTTQIKMLRIGSGAPTASEVLTMFEQESDTLQLDAFCCLGGVSPAVSCVSLDPITGQTAVGASGVSVFKGLMRTRYIDTLTSQFASNDIIDLSIAGATISATYTGGAAINRQELAAVMVESSGVGGAPAAHSHGVATTLLPGFMSAADKAKLDGPMPVRDVGDAQLTSGDYTVVAADHGRALAFATTGAATAVFPAGLPRGTVVTLARGTSDLLIEAGAGATVTFQYPGDTKVARVNGRVTVDNIKAATQWVVSEGTV